MRSMFLKFKTAAESRPQKETSQMIYYRTVLLYEELFGIISVLTLLDSQYNIIEYQNYRVL